MAASNNTFSSTESSNRNGPRLVVATTTPPPVAKVKPFFVIYYLWWSTYHWNNKLGTKYPYSAKPSPLPATVDSSGCNAKSKYAGNQLTDVSDQLAYQQDGKDVILKDVRLAASMGVTGFAVNWRGDGTTKQTPTSDSYNKRLQATFDAVKKVNAEGIPFKLMLNYKGSAQIVPVSGSPQRHRLFHEAIRQGTGIRPHLLQEARGDLRGDLEVRRLDTVPDGRHHPAEHVLHR